ncbi:MAG: sigma-70 family RNA polymerase sigma factor [Phycisphaerales bacterium]|nr:sigma-70 family RNA polymerase sigma factor [Phycisphaerales bacterium]
MDTITSLTLLAKLRDTQDDGAWRRFDQRYRPMILAFARKMCVRDADAHDIAQEVIAAFISAYRDGTYDHDKGSLRGWLFRVTHHRIIDARRAGNGPPPRDGGWPNLESRDTAEQIWEAQWREFVIQACIKEVRRHVELHTFEAFRLYVLEEVPAEDVAARLGIERSAVYVAKSRVLHRMRKLLRTMEEIW